MKKIASIALGIALIAGATSCQKKYTCTCVYPNSTIGTSKTEFKAKKKSDAETQCGNLNTGAKLQGGACSL